jgi:2-methylisocitrate lyase-like PEP mutase family enzyme
LLIANMTEFGKTQRITMDEFGKIGYHGVIYPVSMMRVMQFAARQLAEAVARDGHTANGPAMQTQSEELAMSRYSAGAEWHFPSAGFAEPADEAMPGSWDGWFEGSTAQNIHSRK